MSVLERRCVFCGFHCGLSVHAIVYGSGRWVFCWGAGLSVAPRWFIGQLFYVWDKRLWRRINEFIGNKCIYSGLSKMRFGTKWQWNCDFLVSQSRENTYETENNFRAIVSKTELSSSCHWKNEIISVLHPVTHVPCKNFWELISCSGKLFQLVKLNTMLMHRDFYSAGVQHIIKCSSLLI